MHRERPSPLIPAARKPAGRPPFPLRMGAPVVVVDGDVLGRNRTGDETYVRELLSGLARLDTGLDLRCVARRADLVPPGITPAVLPVRSRTARLAWGLPVLLRRESAALAHFQYIVPPAYRGRAVVTVHDLSYELLPQLEDRSAGVVLRRLVPPSVRRAAVVLTVSEWTKRDLTRLYGLDPDRVVVTYNGVDPDFTPDGPRPSGRPYLLFVGALRSRKDPVSAVDALARLGGDLRMVMVGPPRGEERAVAEAVARHGLASRVELRGHVGRAELAALYRGAQCLVLPTRFEGFGLPIVEAMASGTPVVSTTAGAVPEIAGEAAVLVAPGDPAALAAGIRRAVAERDRLVEAGLQRARRFSWQRLAETTLGAYERALDATPSAG